MAAGYHLISWYQKVLLRYVHWECWLAPAIEPTKAKMSQLNVRVDSHWECVKENIQTILTAFFCLFTAESIDVASKGCHHVVSPWHTKCHTPEHQHITSPHHIHPVTRQETQTSRRNMAYRQMGGFGPVGWALATPQPRNIQPTKYRIQHKVTSVGVPSPVYWQSSKIFKQTGQH